MVHSYLLFDVGMNPDRPRPARLWLRNRYRVHQRLCMGFPSEQLKVDDPFYISVFDPSRLKVDQAHTERGTSAGFLYRIDPQPGGRVVLLVQSAVEPDWDYAFQNAPFKPTVVQTNRTFDPQFQNGELLRFRLEANPVRSLNGRSMGQNGLPIGTMKEGESDGSAWLPRLSTNDRRQRRSEIIELSSEEQQKPRMELNKQSRGKRVPVIDSAKWLEIQGKRNGFFITELEPIKQGYVSVWKPAHSDEGDAQAVSMASARFDGQISVTDHALLANAVIQGIGRGKAFGFGLLSALRV